MESRQQLIRRMILDLLGERWGVGGRLPAIEALAEELGVGRSNAYQAVRQLVREGLLESSRGRGTVVVRVPDGSEAVPGRASILPGHAPGSLAGRTVVIVYARGDGFVLDAVEAAGTAVRRRGGCMRLAVCDVLHTQATLDQHADADAFVLFNPNPHPAIRPSGNQLVVTATTAANAPVAEDIPHDNVMLDSWHAGSLAGRRLREVGCESVCFLAVHPKYQGRQMDMTSHLRLLGFQEGFGAAVPDAWQMVANGYRPVDGERSANVFMHYSPRPQGVFAASDDMAIGFVLGGLAMGLMPGRDYQIVSVDGQHRARDLLGYSIATVAAPMAEMGSMAVSLLAERFAHPHLPSRNVLLRGSLLSGNTTRPPSNNQSGQTGEDHAQVRHNATRSNAGRRK